MNVLSSPCHERCHVGDVNGLLAHDNPAQGEPGRACPPRIQKFASARCPCGQRLPDRTIGATLYA